MCFIYIGEILYIASLSLFADLFYYIIGFFAFIGLRIKEKDLERPFKSPLGIPFALISIIIYLIMMKELDKAAFITGVIWCIIGVIVYLFFSKKTKCTDNTVDIIESPSYEEKIALDKEFKLWSIVVGVLFVSTIIVYSCMYIF